MSLSPSPSRRRRRPGAAPARRVVLLLLAPALVLGACADADGAVEHGDAAAVTPGALAGSTSPAATSTPGVPPTEQAEETVSAAGQDGPGPEQGDPDEVEDPEVWATFTAEPGRAPDDVSEAFADDPRLQVVLTFNEEFARAVTADDPRRAQWLATLDEDSYPALMDYLGDEFGKDYPGPLPFTPLDVGPGSEDGTASVQGCIISSGFALGPEGLTGATVTSIEYALVEDPAQSDAWLVQAMWAGAYDCSTTDVPARLW
jgi:hypothetical protein